LRDALQKRIGGDVIRRVPVNIKEPKAVVNNIAANV
jgi:hypothetical protein